MSRILIAGDETRLAAFLEKGLRSNGFTTTTVSDGPPPGPRHVTRTSIC